MLGPSLVLALAMIGDALIYVVLPLHAADFGIAFFWVGIMLAANRVVRIFFYGAVADLGRRLGARRLSVAAALAAVVSTAACAATVEEWALLAARVLWGLAFASLNLMTFAYAASLATHAGRRLGTSRSVVGVAQALTLTLGAAAVSLVGPRDIFWMLAAITALAVPLALRLPELEIAASTRRGLLIPAPSRVDLWALAQGFAVDGVFLVTLSFLLKDRIPADSAVLAAGLVLAARWAVEIVFAPLSGALADRFGATSMVALFTLGLIGGFLAIAAGWIYVGAIAVTLTRGLTNTGGSAMVAERNPGDAVGAQSAYATWRDIGAALGPLFAGFFAEGLGRAPLYFGVAALMAVTLALLAPSALRRRKP